VGRERAAWDTAVVALFAALATALILIVQWRYAIFRNGVDLGIFTQVVAGVGRGFSSTAEGGVNHLLVHWSPIIVTGWPFVRGFGPLGLQYFQVLLVAAVLFPIGGLARARFGARAALALVAVCALYPILWANGVGDFHEMAFVPLLSATLVYGLDRRRWSIGLVAAVLLLCTKEDQFVVLFVNGVLFAATAGSDLPAKRMGTIVAALAIVFAGIYFGIVRSALNPHVAYASLDFFNWTGHGGAHDFSWSVLAPRVTYLVVILAPVAFLPCISRYGLFLIVGFVEVLASRQPVTLAAGAHYSALLTGYVLAGFVDGASRLAAYRPRLSTALVAVAAVISVWFQIFASPMEYWYYLYRRPNAHDEHLTAALRRLPPRGDVGAEDEIFAHLGLNPRASIDFAGQQWFVYDRTHYSERWAQSDEPAVRRALALGDYAIASDRDAIVVLRRLGPPRGAKPPNQ
jgi:uncharacterized membrane protein